MPQWEQIDYDPQSGIRKLIAANEHEEDSVLVRTEFDPRVTQAILDQNKASANHATGTMGEFVKVAQIPPQVQYDWWHKYRINSWSPNEEDQKRITKLLNSNDYRYLKCRDIII